MAKVGRWLQQHYVVAVLGEGEDESAYLDANGYVCGLFDAVYFDSEDAAIAHKMNAKQRKPHELGHVPLEFILRPIPKDE